MEENIPLNISQNDYQVSSDLDKSPLSQNNIPQININLKRIIVDNHEFTYKDKG